MYVTNRADGTLSLIDASSLTQTATWAVGRFPWWVSLSADGSTAYVSNIASNKVSFVNTTSGTVWTTARVGTAPWSAVADPTYYRVYVANTEDGSLTFLNGDGSIDHTTSIATGAKPYELEVTPAGNSLLVPDFTNGTLWFYRIRSTSLRQTGSMSLGGTPASVTSIHEVVVTN